MLLAEISPGDLMPKKVLAVALVRFFKELNEGLHELLSPITDSFGNELNMDTDQPDMRLLVSFAEARKKVPSVQIRSMVTGLAKKHRLAAFKPRLAITYDAPYDVWINVSFDEPLELDDEALDLAWEEGKRLSIADGPEGTAASKLTVNG